MEPTWWSSAGTEAERSLGVEIVLLDAYVNMHLCVYMFVCVYFFTQDCVCVASSFYACSGHTCTSLSVCFGCQGVDALSLFHLCLQESSRTLGFNLSYTHRDHRVSAELKQKAWVSSIPPLSSKSSRTMRHN